MFPRPVTHRLLVLLFGLVLGFLMASSVVSWRAATDVIENEQLVVHTQYIISELRGVQGAVLDAEIAKYSYFYSRRAEDLTPFYQAKDSIEAHLGRIYALTADSPVQQQRARYLDEAVRAKYARVDSVVQVSRVQGSAVAAPYMADVHARRLLSRVRLVVDEMSSAEEALMEVRSEASQASVSRLLGTFGLTALLAIVLVAFLYGYVRNALTLQRIEAEGMAASNERLASAVDERTQELQQANHGLHRITEELQRSNRELQDFAYVASHDLQEPLRKIRAFSGLLSSDYGERLDDEGRHYLERVDDAATRMSRLISDLLTFSRVSSKARAPEPVDLNTVMEAVLDDLGVARQEARAEVQVVGTLPTVSADPGQMHQLLQNLVGNAVKFRKPDEPARVQIWAEAPEGDASRTRLFVRDEGIGFDEKYADRIFTPFERLHAKQKYAGTGIGLAVCRRIVERHGGTIRATSATGEGTTFTFVLPVSRPEVEPSAPVEDHGSGSV